jgi:hypothetical protein
MPCPISQENEKQDDGQNKHERVLSHDSTSLLSPLDREHPHGTTPAKTARSRTPHKFANPALAPLSQRLQDVLGINPSGDELRAILHHRGEHTFSVQIHEGHAAQVHHALSKSILDVCLLPIRFELRYPRPGEPALQVPSLFCGLVDDGDSQHCSLRSQSEIAHGVPFSNWTMKFLKVDAVAGDSPKKKNSGQEACQRATARFMAACRFHGIEKFMNPIVGNKI